MANWRILIGFRGNLEEIQFAGCGKVHLIRKVNSPMSGDCFLKPPECVPNHEEELSVGSEMRLGNKRNRFFHTEAVGQ